MARLSKRNAAIVAYFLEWNGKRRNVIKPISNPRDLFYTYDTALQGFTFRWRDPLSWGDDAGGTEQRRFFVVEEVSSRPQITHTVDAGVNFVVVQNLNDGDVVTVRVVAINKVGEQSGTTSLSVVASAFAPEFSERFG